LSEPLSHAPCVKHILPYPSNGEAKSRHPQNDTGSTAPLLTELSPPMHRHESAVEALWVAEVLAVLVALALPVVLPVVLALALAEVVSDVVALPLADVLPEEVAVELPEDDTDVVMVVVEVAEVVAEVVTVVVGVVAGQKLSLPAQHFLRPVSHSESQ
jgi:hypothetical protein